METNDLVFRNENGVPMTTSYLVADTFNKPHYQVLRDIENIDEFLIFCYKRYKENFSDVNLLLYLAECDKISV